jgi:hypothetical protein
MIMTNMQRRFPFLIVALLLIGTSATTLLLSPVFADDSYVAPPVSPPPGTADQPLLTADQLDDLLSPIALYPDPLIAQILPAAANPDDIAAAADWLAAGNDPAGIDDQGWDPSVAAVARYPDVLKMLNNYGDWTSQLGAAFANQQADVFASIQRLRTRAQSAGSLVSTPQQNVVVEQNVIEIIPADPQVIYVPTYDPQICYVQRAPITFSSGFPIGVWLDNDCNWGGGYVVVGGGWRYWRGGRWSPINNQPVFYPGRPGYRPGWDGHPYRWVPPRGRPIYRPPPGRPPMIIPGRPGGGRPIPLPYRPGPRPTPGRPPGINPPRPQPGPSPRPAPSPGPRPALRPQPRQDEDRGRPAPSAPDKLPPPSDVKRDADRGRDSRTPSAPARPAPDRAAPARPAPAPRAPAPAPAREEPRQSSPGPAFGGYGSKQSAGSDSSRGAQSRGRK